jgi:hypothetical protein
MKGLGRGRRRARLLVMALAVAVFVLPASSTLAGSPGVWSRVTAPDGRNIDQVSLARTADGVLHLAWLQKAGAKENLVQSAITPSGGSAGSATVQSGWSALNNPALVVDGGGLRVLFAGIRTTSTTDPYSGGSVYSATAGPSGKGWKLAAGAVAGPSSAYASDQVGAAVSKDGTQTFAWSGTFGLFVHPGLDPTVPNQKQQSACCAYSAGLGTDSAADAVVLAWFSNAAAHQGLYARRVQPTPGPTKYLSGSADATRHSAVSTDQVVGVTGRIGAPGVYIAYGVGYPTWKAVNLYEYTSGRTLHVATGTEIRHVSVAAGPDGRVWVMWADGDRIFATRSNRQATVFGATVPVDPPHGTDTIWKLFGNGSLGPLDLLASVSMPGSLAFWHTQVPPGLTLTSAPGPPTKDSSKRTTVFHVLDAGDPVGGAKVTVSGRTLTTSADGRASADLPAGKFTATAGKPGYTSATASGSSA